MLASLPTLTFDALTDGTPLATMILVILIGSAVGYLLTRYGEFLLLLCITALLVTPLVVQFN